MRFLFLIESSYDELLIFDNPYLSLFSQHSNLLSIKDSFVRGSSETHPGQYLVMPYCAGGSLQKHLFGGSGLPNYRDRLKIARGLAAGLAYLHAKRIFHRDVKPDNVLLTANLEPRLADFGVSKEAVGSAGNAAATTTFCTRGTVLMVGTPGYTAPESQSGKYGPKTDIFAAGVLLLQLATGKAAVSNKLTMLYSDVRGLRPPPLPADLGAYVSPEWATWCNSVADPNCIMWSPLVLVGLMQLGLRCTEHDRKQRPPAQGLLLLLEELSIEGSGIRVPWPRVEAVLGLGSVVAENDKIVVYRSALQVGEVPVAVKVVKPGRADADEQFTAEVNISMRRLAVRSPMIFLGCIAVVKCLNSYHRAVALGGLVFPQ